MRVPHMPVCMTIAGSDSGGGAGIQADLRSFQYFGTHGTTVITALTSQNPHEVTRIHPVPVEDVVSQFRTVMKAIKVSAIKTGMLFSAEIIEAISAEIADKARDIPVVVDPVMVATSGAILLQDDAIDALAEKLVPLATIITPNVPEAEILAGRMLNRDEDTAVTLAGALSQEMGVAALVKGGHLDTGRSTDILASETGLFRISTPLVEASTTHGTGCMLSSAIAANLALGKSAHQAIVAAKAYIYHNLCDNRRIGPRAFAMAAPKVNDETIVGVARIR